MTMTMQAQSRHHLDGLPYDHMSYPATSPQSYNPWAGSAPSSSSNLYTSSTLPPSTHTYDALSKDQVSRSTSTLPYNTIPVTGAPMSSSTTSYPAGIYSQPEIMGASQYEHGYPSSSMSSTSSYAPTSTPYATSYGALPSQNDSRRLSHHSVGSHDSSYSDALDAGRGMLAMSQDMTTPRNIYGAKSDRSTPDSYFPSSHSSHSSVSSASSYPYDYASSVSGYSSQSEMGDTGSRTLPPPSSMIATNGALPAPASMMGQFNSKISSSTQKKHKCKVCDKRFTRPSSLQTHMYSHTGEKPFACEYDGCGRHFSVVSNLRRHKKVHKGEGASDHESPEGSWMTED